MADVCGDTVSCQNDGVGTIKCDWILENPVSTHIYNYLGIQILII